MNEQQIRDALRDIADAGGEPDADAGWDEVRRGITSGRTSRSRRVVLGGAVVAVAAAAAAFALVPDLADDEAVQVGPSGEPTVTPTTIEGQPDEEVGSGTPVPDHPMAVVVEDGDGQRLDLYDADTGALLQRDLARSERITNVSIDGPSLIYTEEVGDTTRVRIMTYDRGRLPFTHTPYVLGNASSGVQSEGTVAYVQHDVTEGLDRIALWHQPTDTTRYLEWGSGEGSPTSERIENLAFSPDGTRLAFVTNQGNKNIRVIDLPATSLSESRLVTNGATDPAWTDLDGMLAVAACCHHQATGVLLEIHGLSSDSADDVGPMTFDPPQDDTVNIAIKGGLLAVVSNDGTLEVGNEGAGSLRLVAIAGTVVDVGL